MTVSAFFTNFGLFLGVISLGLALYATLSVRRLQILRKSFFAGKNGADLEKVLEGLSGEMQHIADRSAALERAHSVLQRESLKAVQKIGTVRFNPFDDGGGNFSFTVALLDAKNNGVVLTSIHGRQQNRIYAKQITEGQGLTALTEEEQQAIAMANTEPQTPNPKQNPE